MKEWGVWGGVLLNLGALEEVGVAGEGSASVSCVGEVGDWGSDAVHESNGDDLYRQSLPHVLSLIRLTSMLVSDETH